MEQAYARALWKMVEGGMDAKKAVHGLLETVRAHGRAELLPRIGKAFARLAEREARKHDLIVSVAREADAEHGKRAAKAALRELGLEADDLKTRVDDTLIGGWRLEGRGVLVDASYKTQLLSLYERVIKA